MLSSLVLSLVMQLPMSSIIDDQPRRLFPPSVVVQEKIVIKKIFVMVDKFGVVHENEDRTKLLSEVDEVNKKVFKLQDKFGQWWEHSDKATLENFINTRNALLGMTTGCATVIG